MANRKNSQERRIRVAPGNRSREPRRTAGSEIQELLDEIRESIRSWWLQLRRKKKSPVRVEAPKELDAIVFTPIAANTTTQVNSTSDSSAAPVEAIAICPVTRQPLNPGSKRYHCRACGMLYSPEGWDFLRQNADGECCGCRSKNTVTL